MRPPVPPRLSPPVDPDSCGCAYSLSGSSPWSSVRPLCRHISVLTQAYCVYIIDLIWRHVNQAERLKDLGQSRKHCKSRSSKQELSISLSGGMP